MLIAAVLCLCAAAALAALGVRALARPATAGAPHQVLRSVGPTQLAAAVMLAAGGVVALSDQHPLALLTLCVVGALGTVAVGVWQGTRYAATTVSCATTCARSGDRPCPTCTRLPTT